VVPALAVVAGGVVAAATASGLTWLVWRWAARALLDVPNERSSHTRPTPKGGGIAIVVVTVMGAWVGWLAIGQPGSSAPLLSWTVFGVLISAVSFVDDLRRLPNRVRFAVHAAGAIGVIIACGYWQSVRLPLLGTVEIGIAGVVVTFVWIAGLTNAWNFMDGIDGIAASQAAVAGLTWFGLAALAGSAQTAALGLVLAAANLGFLTWNWSPARIFMGDVGSAFVGYTLSVMPLLAMATGDSARGDMAVLMPLASALAVWPFVFDASFTFLRRLSRNEDVFAAHRSHLYQRLVIAGLSHGSVSLGYTVLGGFGCLVALALLAGRVDTHFATAVILPLAVGLASYTRRCERIRAT